MIVKMRTKLFFYTLSLVILTKLSFASENFVKENIDNNPHEFHIGGVLSSFESEEYFHRTIEV